MKAQICITEIKRLTRDLVSSYSFNQATQLAPMSMWFQIIHHVDN